VVMLNMRSNKGFTLIEVLVATLILFLSIVTVMLAYRQYEHFMLKQKKYEKIYITVLSLLNKIQEEKASNLQGKNGVMNGIKYSIHIVRVASKRNYVYSPNPSSSGNYGDFMINLYKITITLDGKKFILYKTEYSKVFL